MYAYLMGVHSAETASSRQAISTGPVFINVFLKCLYLCLDMLSILSVSNQFLKINFLVASTQFDVIALNLV